MGYLGQPIRGSRRPSTRPSAASCRGRPRHCTAMSSGPGTCRWAPASWRWATRCCWRAPPNGWPASSRTSRAPAKGPYSAIVCGCRENAHRCARADTGSGASGLPPHPRPAPWHEAGVVGQQEGDGATSAGAPRRFIGTEANALSASLPAGRVARNISVSIGPGATALTVMPYSASSSAQVRVQPTSALGRRIGGALQPPWMARLH